MVGRGHRFLSPRHWDDRRLPPAAGGIARRSRSVHSFAKWLITENETRTTTPSRIHDRRTTIRRIHDYSLSVTRASTRMISERHSRSLEKSRIYGSSRIVTRVKIKVNLMFVTDVYTFAVSSIISRACRIKIVSLNSALRTMYSVCDISTLCRYVIFSALTRALITPRVPRCFSSLRDTAPRADRWIK